MEITINTPALLFPAISLIMLAYSNRFLAIANLIRNLVKQYEADKENKQLHNQIMYLNFRLNLIRNMQVCGIVSFLLALVSMYLICIYKMEYAHIFFGLSVVIFSISLIISLIEIYTSTKALKIVLKECNSMKSKKKCNSQIKDEE